VDSLFSDDHNAKKELCIAEYDPNIFQHISWNKLINSYEAEYAVGNQFPPPFPTRELMFC